MTSELESLMKTSIATAQKVQAGGKNGRLAELKYAEAYEIERLATPSPRPLPLRPKYR